MLRKFHFFLLILLLSSIFVSHTFADENGDPIDIQEIIAEGDVEFPSADGAAYVQGNAEYQKIPDVILGDPDFEKMRDLPTDSQDYQLGRKVGMLFIRDRAGEGFLCTGFLVGPDLLLTNHHCVHDEAGLRPLATAAIFMDYYQERDVDGTFGGITARVSELVHADAVKDYALLRLDSPIGDTYGWLQLDTTTVPDTSQSVKIIQHPQGRSKEIVRRNSQIINLPVGHPLFNKPYALSYLADSEAGSSGSPVFLRDGTGVIAIHHSGFTSRTTGPFNNSGSLMSHIAPEIQQYLPVVEAPSVYWIDSSTDKIQGAARDGSNVQDIVTTGMRTPTGITVDYTEDGKVYWIDSGTDKIQRAGFFGANIEDIVTTGLRTPTGIAVDVVNDKVYWVDSGTDKIQRANLDGSNIEDIITTGLRTPTGIAVDYTEDSKVYWIDSSTDKIQRANLDGSNIEDVVTTGLRTPTGIALGIAQEVPTRPPGPGPGPGPGPDPVAGDVNGDGQVTVLDLAMVALFYGTQVAAGVDLAADVNDDGTVDLADLTLVAQAIDAAGNNSALSADDVEAVLEAIADIEGIAEAPARFSTSQQALLAGVAYQNVAAAFADVKHLATEDARLGKWMPVFTELLHLLTEMREIPDTTALLPNYPNPFNPETWIPYQLAKPAEVTLTIYAVDGQIVRTLSLGYQVAGMYQSRSRAAYWDGRNAVGEPVASGLYFYTLTAGEFTATRKMLIAK